MGTEYKINSTMLTSLRKKEEKIFLAAVQSQPAALLVNSVFQSCSTPKQVLELQDPNAIKAYEY